MQVHRGLNQLPKFKSAVLTIGSFDGVHHGHRMIISRLIEKAKEVDGESIILTFDPHPRQVVFPNDDKFRLLNTLEEKIDLLKETNLDHLIIVPFTVEFSQINPYRYVDEILIEKIKVRHLIIGYDHRFGLNREGDISLLNIYAGEGKFTVEEIPKQEVDHLHVSSTKIRNHLLHGEIGFANKLLGASYPLSGIVTKGSQIAGALGYPTANCEIREKTKLIPVPGTYAAKASCNGKEYEGMLYIGKSPTLQQLDQDVIEMNLFATLEESLYGKKIYIYPEKRFRSDQKFNTKIELSYNIEQDKTEVEHFFQALKSTSATASVILNYNGTNHLKQFLKSHVPKVDQEIVIIDNASTDDSMKIAATAISDVRIIQLKKNIGFAGGYNEGLKQVGSKYVALVNSDVGVTENWLAPLIAVLDNDPSVAAVQPKILSVDQPEHFEYAGASGGFIDVMGYPLCRGRIMNTLEQDSGQYNQQTEVFWTSGAAMLIRSDLFKKAGGFDNDFFAHMEEIDLCWRLKKAGYRMICEPSSVVYHLGGGTLNYESPQKTFLNLRNNYWMILKNFAVIRLLYTLPLRLGIDLLYIFQLVLKGNLANASAGLKGIFLGVTGVSNLSKKRRNNKFFSRRYRIGPPSKTGMISTIIPFSYYIFGKKKFSRYK